jgi:spore maturation protein CgeB
LIVGVRGAEHVGTHFANAARTLGLATRFGDSGDAYRGPWWWVKFNWHLRQHRPARLHEFSREVVAICREWRPAWMLTTGVAPVTPEALAECSKLGVKCLNFLTDDPWNPAHRTDWMMKALPEYDHVFSPRRANLADLQRLGCRAVSYLPFAYAPEIHFPETPADRARYEADVVFAGGADADRVVYLSELIRAGFNVALYGGYWQRYQETKGQARGMADPPTLRKALGGAKVALCLVRRANRDGHAMRTFEAPAIGGAALLVEDTEEHRAIFGPENEAVLYFDSLKEMVAKTRWLVKHEPERQRLAQASHRLITQGGHTYQARLAEMLYMLGFEL